MTLDHSSGFVWGQLKGSLLEPEMREVSQLRGASADWGRLQKGIMRAGDGGLVMGGWLLMAHPGVRLGRKVSESGFE